MKLSRIKTLSKSVIAVVIASSISLVFATRGFAESITNDDGSVTENYTLDTPGKEYHALTAVDGHVAPALANFSITTCGKFAILPYDPDPNKRFVSPDIILSNEGPAPVKVSASSMGTMGGGPLVSEHDKFSDWTTLGQSDTKSYIAFGLTGDVDHDFWFHDQNAGGVEDGFIGLLRAGESSHIQLKSKFGLAWNSETVLQYFISFTIELA